MAHRVYAIGFWKVKRGGPEQDPLLRLPGSSRGARMVSM